MNRSSRREEAPINFGFRISDFEKRASYSEKGIGGNARPHPAFAGRTQSGHLQQNCYGGRRPGPLPRERTPRTLCAPCSLEPASGPLTPSLSPSEGERVPEGRERRRFMGRRKHAQFPEFSRPLVWNCFMGTHVGCYEVHGERGLASVVPLPNRGCSPPF